MITRYIIPIRIVIVLAVMLASIYYTSGQNQAETTKNSRVPISSSQVGSVLSVQACLNDFNSCKSIASSLRKDEDNTNTQQVAAAHSASACQTSQLDTSTYKYDQAITKILVQANSTIDGYRQTALVNGESYVDFNNQLSDLYVVFNAQIQQDYNNYIGSLGSCKTTITTPQLFQDYD